MCAERLNIDLLRFGAGSGSPCLPPRVVIGQCLGVQAVCLFATQRAIERDFMWRATAILAAALKLIKCSRL